MTSMWTTHLISVDGDVVVKRFRSWARGEHRREWQGLTLLAAYAPGLAAVPVRADLDARPPTVVMSRVPGAPLGPGPLAPAQVDALAGAVIRMHRAVPPGVLAGASEAGWPPGTALAGVRRMARDVTAPQEDALLAGAYRAVVAWLACGWSDRAAVARVPVVFGHGDGNPANFLWDGGQVRVVDFEDAGRSDRAVELAEFVEHLGVWLTGQVTAGPFLERFDLGPGERERTHGFRRLFAAYWFLRLLGAGPEQDGRNPPGTLPRQAARVLDLLDSPAPPS
ncbi:MAG TPA: aminoglycoside phosphotransferase family protein [Actinocrinis sp.]|nr:aminoglycoside phosphotransferase family protein [Actinocrinis sp.]